MGKMNRVSTAPRLQAAVVSDAYLTVVQSSWGEISEQGKHEVMLLCRKAAHISKSQLSGLR